MDAYPLWGSCMTKSAQEVERPRVIEGELNRLFSLDWLRQTAKETGFVKRERKIKPALMFWVLSLGFSVQHQRTLAGLRRLYEEMAGVHINRSSFYDRFTPELARYLHVCVLHGIEKITQNPNRMLKDKLAGFEDLVTQDNTVIRLHEKLAKVWPATRTKKIAAGVKVSLLVSVVADGPKRVALYGERKSDIKTLRIGPWIRDRILLIDLGFYKHHTFVRIDENGGYFVSRLKGGVDPLIVGTNRTWRGRSKNVVGKRLSEVLPKLKRQVIDVEVDIEFKRRKYSGKQRTETKRFRLVAVYNVEDKKYHTYITNISADKLDAEDIAVLYSARWEIELIFKEIKSGYNIDVITTSKPQVVEAFIWIGILALIVSRRVYTLVYSANLENAPRYTHLRWATVFAEKSYRLLDAVLEYANIEVGLVELLEIYQSQALDPNVNRKRLMDYWRA